MASVQSHKKSPFWMAHYREVFGWTSRSTGLTEERDATILAHGWELIAELKTKNGLSELEERDMENALQGFLKKVSRCRIPQKDVETFIDESVLL
jgi:hypothetical protein